MMILVQGGIILPTQRTKNRSRKSLVSRAITKTIKQIYSIWLKNYISRGWLDNGGPTHFRGSTSTPLFSDPMTYRKYLLFDNFYCLLSATVALAFTTHDEKRKRIGWRKKKRKNFSEKNSKGVKMILKNFCLTWHRPSFRATTRRAYILFNFRPGRLNQIGGINSSSGNKSVWGQPNRRRRPSDGYKIKVFHLRFMKSLSPARP